MSFLRLFTIAGFSRAILILYGHWHDSNFEVKYTDVDYQVFSDAAEHVFNGNSPYKRTTYRYTPVLAYLLVPNSMIHESFGKVFFSLCDLAVAILILEIFKSEHTFSKNQPQETSFLQRKYSNWWLLSVWLFNPLTLTISTRGNAESFQAFLVHATLLCIMKGWHFSGGIFYGLAIHFKIYPVIYCLPILLYLWRTYDNKTTSRESASISTLSVNLVKAVYVFACSAGITLISVTWLMYQW